MILLVSSTKDTASMNIANHILRDHPFQETEQTFQENPLYSAKVNGRLVTFITLKEEAVNAQNLLNSFPEAELLVFVSRHSSQSGKPTLTVHTPGNFGEAELGGLSRTVSVSPATAMVDALKALSYYKEKFSLDYEVSYECTHHGPSLNVPTMFVELGSCEKQWSDLKAAEAVAHSAIEALTKFDASPGKTAVLGIGGTHYNQKFTRMALEGKAVFSHMIPKYAIANIDKEILSQCVQKTLEKVTLALLDWKGIRSEDKPKLLKALMEADISYKKV